MARIESARGRIGPLSKLQMEEMVDPRDTRRMISEWVETVWWLVTPTRCAGAANSAVPTVHRRGCARSLCAHAGHVAFRYTTGTKRPNGLLLLKSSTTLAERGMATVNFSVPDDLKAAFNKTFEGYNKSAVVAALMREAIDREQAEREGKAAVGRILGRRSRAPVVSQARIRAARQNDRP